MSEAGISTDDNDDYTVNTAADGDGSVTDAGKWQ